MINFFKKEMAIGMIVIFVFLSAFQSNAQKRYTWDTYDIGFAVEQDFKVLENNANIFSAISSDEYLAINIEPWKDASINMDHLADGIVEMAKDLGYYKGGDINGDSIKIDDFEGYFIISAYPSQDFDFIIFAVLLDTNSSTNLIVSIGYDDGNGEEARNMLLSLYSYD